MLMFVLCTIFLGAENRPIDEISTWVQYGESVCWVAGDWNACCAPEYGPSGNSECWVAFPLSYENCCLEHWQVCDEVAESRNRATHLLSSSWHMFYESCARGQNLLNSLQRLWSAVGFQQELCKLGTDSCSSANEQVSRIWQKLEVERSALSNKNHWAEALDGVLDLSKFEPFNLQFADVLSKWSPQSFGEILDFDPLGYVALGERLMLFRDHLERFRDSMLNVLYMDARSLTECGEICEIHTDDTDGTMTLPLQKHFSCNTVLNLMVNRTSLPSIPPPSIPKSMLSAYSMNGQVSIQSHSSIRRALGFAGGVFPAEEEPGEWIWSQEAVEKSIAQAYAYQLTPGPNSLNRVKTLTDVLADLPELVGQQHWIVWGDNKHFEWWKPWMESLLLSFGAATVSSIVPKPSRYETTSPHPQLRPIDLQQATWDAPFHGVVLMGGSSAGIGRHGDALNPNEDLQQAAAAWCLLRSGGILIAPPMTETDLLRWPMGRVYGRKRWPHLVANFELLRVYDGVAAVLRKPT